MWTPIPGFDLYEINQQGEIRSYADRRCSTPRLIHGTADKRGYIKITLRDENNKPRTLLLHQLLMLTFVGLCPDGKEVRHYDDVKSNNSLENLIYGTHKENIADAIRNGKNPNLNKASCPEDHEYTKENTYVNSKNQRVCRKCTYLRNKKVRKQKQIEKLDK